MSGPRDIYEQNLELNHRISRRVCTRGGFSGADVDDFVSDVHVEFLKNDCERLRKFEGRANLKTYLTIVITRLFQDYRNKKWGKWRPSAKAKELGESAILLEQLTVRDGHSLDEAVEILLTNLRVESTRGELWELWRQLPSRTRKQIGPLEGVPELPASDRADRRSEDSEAEEIGRLISEVLRDWLAGLGDEDRLLLRMRYRDGISVASISRAFGLKQRTLYSRFETLLRQLRKRFKEQGIDAEAAAASEGWEGWQDLLGEPDPDDGEEDGDNSEEEDEDDRDDDDDPEEPE